MRERRRGHLVGLSSLASYRGLPLLAGYCASKAGLNALLDSLRVELQPWGIAVTTLCPGWIRTPMTAELRHPPSDMLDLPGAVEVMIRAIRSRSPFVAFPARLAWQTRMLKYLPRRVSDALTRRYLRQASKNLP
jgi:short-subunit dehydrogenase